jgi:hypothetical protein
MKVKRSELKALAYEFLGDTSIESQNKIMVMISVSRCARISYETLGDDPKIDYEADLKLYDILTKSGHWSPTEHVARAMTNEEYCSYMSGKGINNFDEEEDAIYPEEHQKGWCRNFKGFIQQRALMD